MTTVERDVIVVGAGPAGAICAAYLAKAGVDVLLLDKEIFPREKVCGDMQSEGIVSHVSELGAFNEMDAMGTYIKNLRLISNSGRECLMPFECFCVPRYEFDDLMVRTAAKWGAEFRQGCRVTGVIEQQGYVKGVKVKFRGRESEIFSKLVIGADGAYSVVAKALGVMKEKSSAIYLGQRAYFEGVKINRVPVRDRYNSCGVFCFDESVRPGYIWILPSGRHSADRGFCNVGMMVYDRDTYKGMNLQQRFFRCLERLPAMQEIMASAVQVSPWQGGKLTDITQDMHKAGNGFMLAGDAASVMMPVTFDGLSAAADSARAVADAAKEAIRRDDFSAEFLISRYIQATEKAADEKAGSAPGSAIEPVRTMSDTLKISKLIQQSMYDPQVIDKIIYDKFRAL